MIYRELVDFHSNSMHSELIGNNIVQFLTSFKLGITPWKGKTTVSFLTYFVEQIRLYNELLVSANAPVTHDSFKITVLDQAVQHIEDLRQVRITYNTICMQLRSPGNFQGYFNLMYKAATVYDAHQQNRSRAPAHDTRKVYATHLYKPDYYNHALTFDHADSYDNFCENNYLDHYNDDDDVVDIDTPLSLINVYAAQQQRRPPSARGPTDPRFHDPAIRLPDSIFSQLSREEKSAWFKLSPDARRMILGHSSRSSSHEPGMAGPPRPVVRPPTGISSVDRRVLFTDAQKTIPSEDLATQPVDLSTSNSGNPSTGQPTSVPSHFPGDLRRLMSHTASRPPSSNFSVNKTLIYTLAQSNVRPTATGALIDRGANGGLAGNDCRVFATNPDSYVNIEGIDRHQVTNIPLVSCGAYAVTKNHGPVILIFHQLAGIQKGPTILSAGQMEAYANKVNERSLRFDPKGQLITTNDGFELPLNIRNGLAYLDIRPYTDSEWDTFPHVTMTSDVDWDPSILDGEFPSTDISSTPTVNDYDNGTPFDPFGSYRFGTIVASTHVLCDHPVLVETVLPYDMVAALENDFATKDGFAGYDDPPPTIPPEPPPTTTHEDHPYNTVEKVSTFIQPSVAPHSSIDCGPDQVATIFRISSDRSCLSHPPEDHAVCSRPHDRFLQTVLQDAVSCAQCRASLRRPTH